MLKLLRCFALLSLTVLYFSACKVGTQAPTQLTTLNGPQGGKIVYGVAGGGTAQGAAMTGMLKTIHNNCGEKPQIGQAFQFNGTNVVGVFFTVNDHPDGNLPLGGMVLAKGNGTNPVQVAMIYDLDSKFGQSVNPMLQQLFTLWNQSGATGTTGGTTGASTSSGTAQSGGYTLPPMRQTGLSDGTATISLPVGWNIVANQSVLGQTTVNGPEGELLTLNYGYNAEDPNNPQVQNGLRRGIQFKNMVVYPGNADLAKSFADIFQKIRAAMGQGPAPMKVDSVTAISGSQGCVDATGQLNPDGTGMRQMDMIMCRSTPEQSGAYKFVLTKCLLPLNASTQQRATAYSIIASYKPNMQRAQTIANAVSAPQVAAMQNIYNAHQNALMSFTQGQIANIHQIGANATALYNSTSDSSARNDQAFSNYLLDQSVVQNNTTGAHSTQWNSVANSLVQSNPSKYSFVSQSNYIPGTDF